MLSRQQPEEHALCLIGGTGRSGTTVLRQIFALHPDVASLAMEARFLTDPDGIVDFHSSMTADWSPHSFDTKLRRLEKLLRDLGHSGRLGKLLLRRSRRTHAPSQAATSSGSKSRLRPILAAGGLTRLRPRYWVVNLEAACPEYEEIVDQLMDRLVEFRFAGRWMGMPVRQQSSLMFGSPDVTDALRLFCRRFIACVCEDQKASHLVEDTPFNLLSFGSIRHLLPESRLVHIYRDPRDVVASYLRRPWSPSEPEMAARYYVGVMRRWESVRETLSADSFIEIGLASLVQQPETCLRQVCSFWELQWSDVLLNVDLSRSNRGRWKTDIPITALPRVERILGPYVERYGESED